jgi:hypothetical protein
MEFPSNKESLSVARNPDAPTEDRPPGFLDKRKSSVKSSSVKRAKNYEAGEKK